MRAPLPAPAAPAAAPMAPRDAFLRSPIADAMREVKEGRERAEPASELRPSLSADERPRWSLLSVRDTAGEGQSGQLKW